MHVVAFSLPYNKTEKDVQDIKRWCTANYGIGFANYTNRPTHADRMYTSRWVTEDVQYGEIRFKYEADVLHFMMVWK